MEPRTLTDLAQKLQVGDETSFRRFRQLFFDALERRLLYDCEGLLRVLCAATAHQWQKECRYHQAVLHAAVGQFDQAEVLLRSLLDEDLSPNLRARTLMELGFILDEISQWDEAEKLYRSALTQYKKNDDLLGQAKAYNNLGVLIRLQVEHDEVAQSATHSKRLQEALTCHETALTFAQAADDPWESTKNWHGKGMVLGLMQQYQAAEAAFEKHLALCQALDNVHDQGISLYDLASLVYQPQGRWAETSTALAQAIHIFQRFEDDLNLAEALTRRGNQQAQQGQLAQALDSYDQALARAETIRTRLTTPTSQAGNRALMESIYVAPLSCQLQLGNAAAAFSAAERARARGLADLLGRQTATPHADIPNQLVVQREAVRSRLDQAYATDEPSSDLADLEKMLADLDRQIELLDPAFAGLTTIAPLQAEDVQQRLPKDAVLLTYMGDAHDRLWIMVVSTTEIHIEPIAQLSVRWLRQYIADHLDGSRRGILVPEPHHAHLEPPRHLFPPLYKTLIEPVWRWLAPAQTVYIVPYGPLHYLPLGSLTPDLSNPPPLLARGRRVVYAPSATILLDYCHTRSPSPCHGVLAIAPEDTRLKLIQGAARTITQRGGSCLVGRAATRQAFLDDAGHYRMVCFLGHGFFDRRYPMSSRLQLSDGNLYASEILRELRLQADLVMLAACETGRGRVLHGDEILGLSRAMLYAGTPSLLVTLWPVHEIPTRLLVEKLIEQLASSETVAATADPATALASAQCWLRALSFGEVRERLLAWDELASHEIDASLTSLWQMTHSDATPQADSQLFAHPFFWAPYVLIGDRPLSHS
jgi:CHAT domain-containing protein